MRMDLCYYGVKEENIPDILDGNFFEEDFSDSEPQHTLRVFSVKELYYVYSGRKELEEEDFQGKKKWKRLIYWSIFRRGHCQFSS